MEKVENKYQRGKIYKIISNQTDDVYIGSTIEECLSNRLSKHKSHYRMWTNKKYTYLSSYEIIKYDDCKIILNEKFACNSRDELRAREQYFIDNNTCINMIKSYIGMSKIEYRKTYYEEHREQKKQYQTEYYNQNHEYYKEYSKEYSNIETKIRSF